MHISNSKAALPNEAIALLRQEYAEQRQLLLSEAGAEVQALRGEVQNLKCGTPMKMQGAWHGNPPYALVFE